MFKICLVKQDVAVGGVGLWQPRSFSTRHSLWDNRCSLWPPALWERGESTAVLLQALTESELEQSDFLFQTLWWTLKLGAHLCGPAVAGSLPAQPAVPCGTGPHPFTPLLSTLSILQTQEKPLRDMHRVNNALCRDPGNLMSYSTWP